MIEPMALGLDKISMWMGTDVSLTPKPPTDVRYLAKLAVLNCLMSKPNRLCVPMIEVDGKEEVSFSCLC